MRNRFPRCTFVNRDNTRCARRVGDASQPPVCHIHKNLANGGTLTTPVELDEVEILRKLARDSNPQVRLRAVDLLLSLKRETSAHVRSGGALTSADVVRNATPAERERLQSLIKQVASIKATILRRISGGAADQHEHPEPTGSPAEVSTTTAECSAEHATPPDQNAVVRVWRNGVLVTERRELRNWTNAEDVK
ncbi:MAG TPA: hypothetical protein VN700_06510 [Vicinamibacterales bacterium]|nr:hypothetical protein [Vicinamibacterales bacterium]